MYPQNKEIYKSLFFLCQSYKHFTLINYDSRVVITSKFLILMTLESQFTNVEGL